MGIKLSDYINDENRKLTPEQIRQFLIEYEFGFARYTGSNLKFIACEIEILEELVSEICEAKGIDTKEFILESQLDGIGIKEGE